MKRIMELLFMSFIGSVLLLGTGCGDKGRSCVTPAYEEKNGVKGIIVPGCGGCFSPREGCNTDTCGLWSEGIVAIGGSGRSGNKEFGLIALDNIYYKKSGCSACGSSERKSCYAICGHLSEDAGDKPESGNTNWVIAIGKDPDVEIGIVGTNGYGGCTSCNGTRLGREILSIAEGYIFILPSMNTSQENSVANKASNTTEARDSHSMNTSPKNSAANRASSTTEARDVYIGTYSDDGSDAYIVTNSINISSRNPFTFTCTIKATGDLLRYKFYQKNGKPYYENSEGYHAFVFGGQSPVAENIYRYVINNY